MSFLVEIKNSTWSGDGLGSKHLRGDLRGAGDALYSDRSGDSRSHHLHVRMLPNHLLQTLASCLPLPKRGLII